MESHVMILGGKGVGKSTIANQLFGLNEEDGVRFPQKGDPGKAMGSQYLRSSCKVESTDLGVHIVEVPGLHVEDEESYRRNWSDIINAFESLRNKVDVFLLVLDFMKVNQSESVTRAFVNLFGWGAGFHAMVLITNNGFQGWRADRSISFFHRRLSDMLEDKFPYFLLPRKNIPCEDILLKLRDMTSGENYVRSSFVEAQMKELERWAHKMKGKVAVTEKRDIGFKIQGFPETLLLFNRYYNEEQLRRIVSMLK